MLNKLESEKLLNILLDFSEIMFTRGCDIARCEDTVQRISEAYGYKADIFAIPSLMVLSLEKDEIVVSQNRRLDRNRNTNFIIVEKLNNLSREICKNPLDINELALRVQEINKEEIVDSQNCLGYFLASSGFVYFYSLNIVSAILSGLFSLLLYYSSKNIGKYCDNHTFFTFIVSFINGLIICLIGKVFTNLDINNIIIGEIMILVPGVTITESVQNLFAGDTTSGQIQFIESILTSAMLAIGYGIALLITGVM